LPVDHVVEGGRAGVGEFAGVCRRAHVAYPSLNQP
jgi:hypothetical protein